MMMVMMMNREVAWMRRWTAVSARRGNAQKCTVTATRYVVGVKGV